ncbi:hypothetical protein GCM10028825_36950 [Spirosoma agri]
MTVPQADKPITYVNRTFTFLNQPVSFPGSIDWNYSRNGKLWTYHLTYFDYLNQAEIDHRGGMTAEEGIDLLNQFIDQTDAIQAGLEPYPTSLRITNWIHFLSRHQITNKRVNAHLFAQTDLLNRRLEYHLAGNHLLENGIALLTGALYFQQRRWFDRASTLIRQELTTQILADGAHDERSPMYHQLLLDRLLDLLTTLRANSWHVDLMLIAFVAEKQTMMLNWLNTITFSNGDVPMVNDAAFNSAPTSVHIQAKAGRGLPSPTRRSAVAEGVGGISSGYRLLRQPRYELFTDVGAVGPDHQPGHAHADTFSFVLYVDAQPLLVDSGTSTYEPGPRRTWERSTAAHNTVEINGLNSSEVWGTFRVGRRASVTLLEESGDVLSAQHDGYSSLGIMHRRTWLLEERKISVFDRVIAHKETRSALISCVARFYFHPGVLVVLEADTVIAGTVRLKFLSGMMPTVLLKPYDMAIGFNLLQGGQYLDVTFADYLNTIVTITE